MTTSAWSRGLTLDKVDLDRHENDGKDEESPRGPVQDLEFDQANRMEMEAHRVSREEVLQVWRNGYALFRNKRQHVDQPYIMVGRTDAGRWLTVPIGRSKQDPAKWRPATAFDSNTGQMTLASRVLRGRI
jgi:hypothetical protein